MSSVQPYTARNRTLLFEEWGVVVTKIAVFNLISDGYSETKLVGYGLEILPDGKVGAILNQLPCLIFAKINMGLV